MLFRIGSAIQMKVQHLQLRGNVFQFYLRVPDHLRDHYGKQLIRQSLGTSDIKEATKQVEKLSKKYKAEFAALSNDGQLTPHGVGIAAQRLAENYDMSLDHFIDHVIEPARQKHSNGSELEYETALPTEYLSDVQIAAWRTLVNPDAVRLSFALQLYLKNHTKGKEEDFIIYASRHWNSLIELVGDIEFKDLSRDHARQFVDHLLSKGNKTGTVRRTLNTVGAIVKTVLIELGIEKQDPFRSLKIQGEGNDKEEGKTATQSQLLDIAKTSLSDMESRPSLLILLQMELGTRIGEVAGLGIDDVFLDNDVPHVYFRNKPWRTLKNKESERRVPVVGIALDALKAAMTLPRTGHGLFEQYARAGGNDSASAAVNKRLKKWDLKSHDFRHTMKDRLREAGCPKDIRDALQGHSSGDIADHYGQGHSLKTMQVWLEKIKLNLL